LLKIAVTCLCMWLTLLLLFFRILSEAVEANPFYVVDYILNTVSPDTDEFTRTINWNCNVPHGQCQGGSWSRSTLNKLGAKMVITQGSSSSLLSIATHSKCTDLGWLSNSCLSFSYSSSTCFRPRSSTLYRAKLMMPQALFLPWQNHHARGGEVILFQDQLSATVRSDPARCR